MCALWHKRLSNLLCIKSIVTIILTLVFAYMSIHGRVTDQAFLAIFSMVIAFYFGTQTQNPDEKADFMPPSSSGTGADSSRSQSK